MTPHQIELVKGTWAELAPIQDASARLFYERLFDLDPTLRSLFNNDMNLQGRRLMSMINSAVLGLDDLDAIGPGLRSLGKRHVDYGVRSEHYGVVGMALLWTLERSLGKAFTAEVRNAWTALYRLLARSMQAS